MPVGVTYPKGEDDEDLREARWSQPLAVGDKLCAFHADGKPEGTVKAIKDDWVTIQRGAEKPVRRKLHTNWLTPTPLIDGVKVVRYGWDK